METLTGIMRMGKTQSPCFAFLTTAQISPFQGRRPQTMGSYHHPLHLEL